MTEVCICLLFVKWFVFVVLCLFVCLGCCVFVFEVCDWGLRLPLMCYVACVCRVVFFCLRLRCVIEVCVCLLCVMLLFFVCV